MDFNALFVLDLGPCVLELVLHFSPYSDRVRPQFPQLLLRLVLQLPEPVALLDDLGFTHQEVELLEVTVGCVVPPGLLDHHCGHCRPSWTLELLLGIPDNRQDLSLVGDC